MLRAGLALAGLAGLAPVAAWAGPPYVTDDPEPTRTDGWENYVYQSGTGQAGTGAPGGGMAARVAVPGPGEGLAGAGFAAGGNGSASGAAGGGLSDAVTGQAGVELNYGAATGVQLSLTVPEAFDATHGLRAGFGDVTAGVKLRLLHGAGGWVPDLAVFPAVTVPTGARGFGSGHGSVFLPVWLERDWGRWSCFGGGGYAVTPGAGLRNNALAGLALTRQVTGRLSLGVEITHQTAAAAAADAPAATRFGIGAVWQVSRHWALMGSGGPGLEPHRGVARSDFYVSLQYTD